MLYWAGANRGADLREHDIACRAVGVEQANLEQFVRGERALDLADHGGGEALLGDADQGREVVGAGAQGAALGGGEDFHGGIVRPGYALRTRPGTR